MAACPSGLGNAFLVLKVRMKITQICDSVLAESFRVWEPEFIG